MGQNGLRLLFRIVCRISTNTPASRSMGVDSAGTIVRENRSSGLVSEVAEFTLIVREWHRP